MDYIEYNFKVSPLQPGCEILIAELAEAGFESFTETPEGLSAYIQKSLWSPEILDDIYILKSKEFTITFDLKEIAPINWNEEWEKNFNPILVENKCSVRAPFHPQPEVEYDIVIEPKMSFGTGHHETTYMMICHILNNDFKGKKVLDMGCGTAVLAILSEMKGASLIDAVDIDSWCYLNSLENIESNLCKNISVYEGDSAVVKGRKYDIILANINRNILLGDIPVYAEMLTTSGELYLSGFYTEDIPAIEEVCNQHGLYKTDILEKNNWVSVKLVLRPKS